MIVSPPPPENELLTTNPCAELPRPHRHMGPWCTCGTPPTAWLEKEAVASEKMTDAAAYVLSIATGMVDDEALRIARRLLIARNQPEGPTHADIRE